MTPLPNIRLSSPAGATLRKLVITTFVRPGGKSRLIHYLEMCGDSNSVLDISSDATFEINSAEGFYVDTSASDAMYKDYEVLTPSNGTHRQRVGKSVLFVSPVKPTITPVAAANGYVSSERIVVDGTRSTTSWGTWIVTAQGIDSSLLKGPSEVARLVLITDQVHVESFYWFVVLPAGYSSLDERFDYLDDPRTLQDREPKHETVMEFSLPDDFPVYTQWSPEIYGKTILKNRRSVRLDGNKAVSFGFKMVDVGKLGRLTSQSFFAGILVAVLASALVGAGIYGLENGSSNAVIASIGALTIALLGFAFVGWRSTKDG